MRIEQDLAVAAPQRDTLLTIGVFDGVHAGHRHLLETLKQRAADRSLLSGVVTFDPHPQSVLHPDNELPWLSDVEDRVRSITELGIDLVVVLTFSKEVAQLTAQQFLAMIKTHLRMRGIVVGPDFALGQGRAGSIDQLRKLGRQSGFSVEAVSQYTANGEAVSSTLIRQALAEGNTRKVHAMMGRYFHLKGIVITSAKRGRKLGFPTANIDIRPQQALPGDGIYATIADVDGRRFASATNVGARPTFGDMRRTVEAYLLNYEGDLYGRELRLEFVQKVRDEQRFASSEELKRQIERDVQEVKAILAEDLR
ncbi:MAG: bifunctional riboflavin kinase/FAD synthetase [Dehalococcoidia bacterium]